MPLINYIKQFEHWLSQERSQNISVFRFLIYSWVIVNTLTYLIDHEFYWGDKSWIMSVPLDGQNLLFKSLNLLSFPNLAPYYLLILILQVLFCVMAIANIFPRTSSLFVWYLTQVLYNKVYITMDGGNNLISLMLFYGIFMIQSKKNDELFRAISNYIANWTLLVARLQLCLVYFVAGHLKMTGTHWTNGTAFYYTFNVDEFTHPVLQFTFSQFPLLSVFFSYLTILFQISFPFLVWNRNWRPILFLFGGAMHIGIAFGMGLVSFGFAMALCYALFFTQKELNRFLALHQYLKFFAKYIIVNIYLSRRPKIET
jgi:hypothetical protein